MKHRAVRTLFCLCLTAIAAAPAASAGTWGTPAVLGTNAFYGSVTLDATGNLNAIWYQNSVQEIWAASAAPGHALSAPVNISGPIGVAPGNPIVLGSTTGNVTAIYSTGTSTATYVDKLAGGNWGTPGPTNGVNQFHVSDDRGDEGLAWSTGGARPTSSTIDAVQRAAGGAWSLATTVASGVHLAFDGSTMAPDGSMSVAWESFDSVCGSRTCTTSNWVLHVSTRALGATSWVDSGSLLGPDAKQHFAQLAADGAGDLGLVALQGSNIVSRVRHGSSWSGTAAVAPTSAVGYYTGTGHDNRVFHCDSAGHATLVSWSNGLFTLVAVDGNLATNTWGPVTTISGADQNPNYFAYAMSSTGTAIVFWSIQSFTDGTSTWRAATRSGPGVAWNPPATTGTSYEGGGTPESVAVNGAGQAAVVFHGYSSDSTTYIQYINTYHP